jgi:hypothetical protein
MISVGFVSHKRRVAERKNLNCSIERLFHGMSTVCLALRELYLRKKTLVFSVFRVRISESGI